MSATSWSLELSPSQPVLHGAPESGDRDAAANSLIFREKRRTSSQEQQGCAERSPGKLPPPQPLVTRVHHCPSLGCPPAHPCPIPAAPGQELSFNLS